MEKSTKITYEPIQTTNENNDRFVLSKDSKGNLWVYDNHKRDGYGLPSEKNVEYLINKLNYYYEETQTLKNENEYHKKVLEKIEEHMNYWFENSLKCEPHSKMFTIAFEVAIALQYVMEDLQGEEYG